MSEISVKKGQEYDLNIESLAYGGKGISRVNDFVIFVKNVIPGQKVRALVYRKSTAKKDKINEIIKTIQSLNVEAFKLL